MIEMIKYLIGLLDEKEQKECKILTVLNLVSPLMDIFSFSAVLFIINTVIRERQASDEIIFFSFFMGIVSSVKGLFDIYKCKIHSQFIHNGTQKLSMKLYELLLKEDLPGHNKKTPVDALSMVRSDTQNCMNIIAVGIGVWINILTMAGYYAVMIYISKWFGVISCMVSTALMMVMFLFNRNQMRVFGEKSRVYAIKTNAQITIAYGSFKEVKIAGSKASLLQKYQDVSREYAQIQRGYQENRTVISVIMQNLVMTVVFIVIGFILLRPEEEIIFLFASMVMYFTILLRMIPMASSIVNGLNSVEFWQKSYKVVRTSAAEYEKIKQEEESAEKIRHKKITFTNGLLVEGLTFGYRKDSNILEEASIHIPSGSCVAVIGVSGIGKTTFLDLILGLLVPQSGSIRYDDYDIVSHKDNAGLCNANLGDIVSYIPQTVYLNGETIRNNVVFLNNDQAVDELKVEESLKCAQIWEDVMKMPDGLDTLIGENGTAMSGGQRQRIALARALYKDFEFLVMDEATAALDMETEKAVIDSIRHVKGKKTLLIATHHMSLANECDRIYKIENKKFVRVK